MGWKWAHTTNLYYTRTQIKCYAQHVFVNTEPISLNFQHDHFADVCWSNMQVLLDYGRWKTWMNAEEARLLKKKT